MTDEAFVRDYALHGAEASFSTLVARHLDLVCSAAPASSRPPRSTSAPSSLPTPFATEVERMLKAERAQKR